MKTVLLAVLITIVAVKITSDRGFYFDKYTFAKSFFDDEDRKSGKGEQEHHKSKTEDTWYCANFRFEYFLYRKVSSPSFISQQGLYCSFINKPNTPPPNRL
jgi:hypothetical protein